MNHESGTPTFAVIGGREQSVTLTFFIGLEHGAMGFHKRWVAVNGEN
jgi:hypothetical protein